MASRDLRFWISQLEKEGELKRVKAKVDWDDEIAQIVRKVDEKEGPALLFENIKDHENTISRKLFTNSLSTISRVNLMANLSNIPSMTKAIQVLKQR